MLLIHARGVPPPREREGGMRWPRRVRGRERGGREGKKGGRKEVGVGGRRRGCERERGAAQAEGAEGVWMR